VKRTSSNEWTTPRSLALNLWPLEFIWQFFCPYEQEEKVLPPGNLRSSNVNTEEDYLWPLGNFWPFPRIIIRVGRVSGWSHLIPFVPQRGSQRDITAAAPQKIQAMGSDA